MTAAEDKKLDTILYKFKAEAMDYGRDDAKRDIHTIIKRIYQRTETGWLKISVFTGFACGVIGYAIGHAVTHLTR